MTNSPPIHAEGPVRVVVSCDGVPLGVAAQLISLTVRRAANTVPMARLEFLDGDMPSQTFALSDAASFKPGAVVKVAAGYGDGDATIFEGIVIQHGLRIGGNSDARLVVECRDPAVKMTIRRRSHVHVDQTDSDIIRRLIGDHGLTADVSATTERHAQRVQHDCSDWDFMLARAEGAGLLVIATDGTLAVKPPAVDRAAVLSVGYGIDLIDFQAEMDARTQWAKSDQPEAGLARIRGRMRFQGSALAAVGTLITVQGVGKRFSGDVFVSAVSHEISDGGWITDVEFGLAPAWSTERADTVTPPAGGLLPGVAGLQIGVVRKLHADPAGEHRVQVSLPALGSETDAVWARLMQFYSSDSVGAFFVPEIGDEVVIGYVNNDPSSAVILGGVYSSQRPPPYTLEAANGIKAIVTRSLARIEINDADRIITVTTPAQNKIVLSDKDPSILLSDQNGNTVRMSARGIAIDTPKDLTITAQGTITLDAVGAITTTSTGDVTSAGLNIHCDAQVGFVAKGAASAELSASGQTTVKGAMVMIN